MGAHTEQEVTCRVASPDEWEIVRKTRLDALAAEPSCFGMALHHDEALTETDWRESLATNRWVLAAAGDEVVGLVALFVTDTYPEGLPQLGSMWVAPQFRRLGLAARLEEQVATLAISLGFAGLGLWVTEGNDGATLTYEALGYARSGAQKPAPRDLSVPMHRMVRDLHVPTARAVEPSPADGTRQPPP